MANMARPKPSPLPPTDFASRDLPIETIATGTRLVRIHRNTLDPLYFGSTAANRFDDPAGQYGVCYLAATLEGAFAETCLRAVGARFVALSFLEARSFSHIEVTTHLRLVSVHGPGLAHIGATAAVTSGPYEAAQRWSRAIHDHPGAPDGIGYYSNHDNDELCVALFNRAAKNVQPLGPEPITNDRDRLAALLTRYKVGLG